MLRNGEKALETLSVLQEKLGASEEKLMEADAEVQKQVKDMISITRNKQVKETELTNLLENKSEQHAQAMTKQMAKHKTEIASATELILNLMHSENKSLAFEIVGVANHTADIRWDRDKVKSLIWKSGSGEIWAKMNSTIEALQPTAGEVAVKSEDGVSFVPVKTEGGAEGGKGDTTAVALATVKKEPGLPKEKKRKRSEEDKKEETDFGEDSE